MVNNITKDMLLDKGMESLSTKEEISAISGVPYEKVKQHGYIKYPYKLMPINIFLLAVIIAAMPVDVTGLPESVYNISTFVSGVMSFIVMLIGLLFAGVFMVVNVMLSDDHNKLSDIMVSMSIIGVPPSKVFYVIGYTSTFVYLTLLVAGGHPILATMYLIGSVTMLMVMNYFRTLFPYVLGGYRMGLQNNEIMKIYNQG